MRVDRARFESWLLAERTVREDLAWRGSRLGQHITPLARQITTTLPSAIYTSTLDERIERTEIFGRRTAKADIQQYTTPTHNTPPHTPTAARCFSHPPYPEPLKQAEDSRVIRTR